MRKTTLRYWLVIAAVACMICIVGGLLYFDNMRWKKESSKVDEVIQETEFQVFVRPIQIGMTESEVINLLGEPTERWDPSGRLEFEMALLYGLKSSRNISAMICFDQEKVNGVTTYTDLSENIQRRYKERLLQEGIPLPPDTK